MFRRGLWTHIWPIITGTFIRLWKNRRLAVISSAVIPPAESFSCVGAAEKVQAYYQHACLLYEEGLELTNQSLRERLNMPKNNSAGASRIIADTVEEGLIKPSNKALESKKFSSYVPYYA